MSYIFSVLIDENRLFNFLSGVTETELLVWTSLFMFLNSSIMTPPSQYVCMAAGIVTMHNNSSVIAVVVAATVANFLGTAIWYVLGRAGFYTQVLSLPIFEHKLTKPYVQILPSLHARFRKRTFLGMALWRLVPVVRSIVSLPAGDLAIPASVFTTASLAGIGMWCFVWTILGVWLGRLAPLVAGLIGIVLGVSAVTIFLYFSRRLSGGTLEHG
jgi:membrane protein DedA with SNARE-associated domain